MATCRNLKALDDYYENLFESLPCSVVVFDDAVRVVDFNRAAFRLMVTRGEELIGRLVGDAFGCSHASEGHGCGTTPSCQTCGLRNAVTETAQTGAPLGSEANMNLTRGGVALEATYAVNTAQMSDNGRSLVIVTIQDVQTGPTSGGAL